MLVNLHVKNFAIIDEIDVDFSSGLNILTGETGAGKSILIGSIGIALGARVSQEIIGKHGDSAMVDVCFVTDAGLKELVDVVCEDIPKYVGDAFTMFLAWVKEHYSVCYVNDYMLTKRISREDENEAYEQEDYLQLLYYLYCPSYIDDRHMYQKAAQSKNYADTWLYLALHFICALRDTDLVRIPHPRLEREPEDILKDIKRGTFTDKEAVKVIYSIIYPLRNSPLKPNKTKRYSSVPYIKFDVPESCEVHIGMLFLNGYMIE